MRYFLFILLLFPLTVHELIAQSFSCSVSKQQVAVGERFKISYRIENMQARDFRAPTFDGFSIVRGPMQSQNMTVVNGAMSQSTEISYYLSAQRTGSITIEPASIVSGNRTIKSNVIEMEVGGSAMSSSANNPPASNMPSPPSTSVPSNLSSQDIFITASANRQSVFEGEQVQLTIQIYSMFNSVSLEEIKYPELKGGWVQDVEDAVDTRFRQENINGRHMNVATLRKSILIPQRSGTLVFDAVTAKVLVQRVLKSGNMWEDFFYGGQVKEERINLVSPKISFHVLPLPTDNRPENFYNAVGKFDMKAVLDKNEIEANDAISLKVTVSGEGNLMLIDKPHIEFPASFEVFDPQISDKYRVTSAGVTGKKIFEFLIVPRVGGDYTFGPVHFSFFDPKQKKFFELKSDTFKIQVKGSTATNQISSGAEVVMIGSDIRYIDDRNQLPTQSVSTFYRSAVYYILAALPFVLILLTFSFRRFLFLRQTDWDAVRVRKANAVAMKRLKKAKDLLNEQKLAVYYEEVNKSLLSYLSDKFSIPFAEMNREVILDKFTQKSLPHALSERVIHVLDTCEFARFSPAAQQSGIELFDEAAELISSLEKNTSL